jgi:ADP-ribose pyrophosphatase
VVQLRIDTVRMPDGTTKDREIVIHPGAVVIVARDEQDRVALVRQYRPAIQRETLELPAGTREAGELPETTARRELTEETGLHAASWSKLVEFYSSPGFCTEQMQVFVATGLAPGQPSPEDDELIEVSWIGLADVPRLIAQGQICDAKSIAGLLTYLRNARLGVEGG